MPPRHSTRISFWTVISTASNLKARARTTPSCCARGEGDWTVARGAYFASVLDEHRNAIDPWPSISEMHGESWPTYVAHDFGSSAPSVTYVVCKSPGGEAFGKFYPRDSLILVDELSTAKPDRPQRGLGVDRARSR
jgi:hypothetical protein